MLKFTLVTNFPVALQSRDHQALHGEMFVNNSRSADFNQQLHNILIKRTNPSVLDIGCAGGGMVHDVLEMGFDAVGLEGSDFCFKNKLREWPLIPDSLFTCDVTKPFILFSGKFPTRQAPHAFDVVTAWEFFEHIEEQDLPNVIKNINSHTRQGSMLICSIAEFSSKMEGIELHRTIRDAHWWEVLFGTHGWQRNPPLEQHFAGHRVRTGSHNFTLLR